MRKIQKKVIKNEWTYQMIEHCLVECVFVFCFFFALHIAHYLQIIQTYTVDKYDEIEQ